MFTVFLILGLLKKLREERWTATAAPPQTSARPIPVAFEVQQPDAKPAIAVGVGA